ncbi:MAG: type II toxin-antitoxin system RelE/ParE family toxin [Polyangiaceae bacterium]|jgi:plasmid stabilization system protein ParE
MRLRLTPRALADAKRMRAWWQRHRSQARDLFDQELDAVLESIVATPNLGSTYEQGDPAVNVRRILMPKTRNHVYYTP